MRFEKREMISLECGDHSQFGMLHLPLGQGPFPVAIICHGFMGDHIGRQGLYVELATRLSKVNIATLRMDFIGCGNSEGDIKKESLESQVNQLLGQIDFLERDERFNSDSLGIIGNSLGGVVSCLTLPKMKHVKCLSITGAIAKGSLWLEEWEKGNPGRKARDAFFYNDTTYEEFKKMEPVNSLKSKGELPALIIHGRDDNIVSRNHYDYFQKQKNSKSKAIILDDVGHYFGIGYQRPIFLDEVTQWMLKYLY